MKIEIYLGDKLVTPIYETEINDLSHKLVWAGTLSDLKTTSEEIKVDSSDDAAVLEEVYFAFNSDERPPRYTRNLRSLSIGDVVRIDDRAYQCLTESWRKLDDFAAQKHKS